MQKALDSMVSNAYVYGRQYIADRVRLSLCYRMFFEQNRE